jgi:hypothetical protein
MTPLDWLELIEAAPKNDWRVEEDRLIRGIGERCPLCWLVFTEDPKINFAAAYTFALRTLFGPDIDLTGAHIVAEAADLPNPPTLEHRLVREYLMLSLGIK